MRVACLRRSVLYAREKVAAGPRVIVRSRAGRDVAFTGCRSLVHPVRARCEIAMLRPRNLQGLELAHGIGAARREKYGAGLLAVVSGEGAA